MRKRTAVIITALIACAIMVAMCLFSGVEITAYPYSSYLLQARAWLEGRTHLLQDYDYLELAIYEGNYYVSFPPVPSVPMMLWTLIFGENVPGGLFQKIYVVLACLLVLSELMRTRRMAAGDCIAWAILLCLGCAMLPVQLVGGVWYEALILAFLLSIAAIVALRRKKTVPACLCYALAVGCRPFSVLLGPVLLMMYLRMNHRLPAKQKLLRLLPGLIAGLGVAFAYGAYNYARFGNPFEFGHNHLPEFVRAEYGQLSLAYLWENLKIFLFGKPFYIEGTSLHISTAGFSMFLSCPIFICNLVWIAKDLILRRFTPVKGTIVLMGALNVILLCMHRTLGGYQFGARYALEMLPLSFCYLLLSPDREQLTRWESAILFFGLVFNFVGGCLIHV